MKLNAVNVFWLRLIRQWYTKKVNLFGVTPFHIETSFVKWKQVSGNEDKFNVVGITYSNINKGGRVSWVVADHRDALFSLKCLAWSIARSVFQGAFSLLYIRFQRPWVLTLHLAEEDNWFPIDLISLLSCQCIKIKTRKQCHIYWSTLPYRLSGPSAVSHATVSHT